MLSSLIVALSLPLSFFVACHAAPLDASSDSGPFTDGVATYYYQNGNAGACGQVHSDYDLICALDSTRYDPSLCGRQIQITNTQNGNTVTVTVADSCPGCSNADSLDLSIGAFSQLADLSASIAQISWNFV